MHVASHLCIVACSPWFMIHGAAGWDGAHLNKMSTIFAQKEGV